MLDNIIGEALAKSTAERVHRRTRRSAAKDPSNHSMLGRIVPKRKGNNDPNQHRGKRNFRGDEKRSQDQEKRDKYTEAVDYVFKYNTLSMSECWNGLAEVEHINQLHALVCKLMVSQNNVNQSWLHDMRELLEGKTLKVNIDPEDDVEEEDDCHT